MSIVFPADLRETRLRVKIDELKFKCDTLTRQNRYLRERCDRKNERLKAIGREMRVLADEVARLERAVARSS